MATTQTPPRRQLSLWTILDEQKGNDAASDNKFSSDICSGQFPTTSIVSDIAVYVRKPIESEIKAIVDPRTVPTHPAFRAYEMVHILTKGRVPVRKVQSEAARKIQEWRRNNPELARAKYRESIHIHRSKHCKTGNDFAIEDFLELCERYGNKCLCCGLPEPLTVDHIIPLGMDGSTNDISNIQPLCFLCNKIKGDDYMDFRPESESNPEYLALFRAQIADYRDERKNFGQ